jgi:hypothetical protein
MDIPQHQNVAFFVHNRRRSPAITSVSLASVIERRENI